MGLDDLIPGDTEDNEEEEEEKDDFLLDVIEEIEQDEESQQNNDVDYVIGDEDVTVDYSSIDDDVIDMTEEVIEFETGKGWDCPDCGFEIGTVFKKPRVVCGKCKTVLVDMVADQRPIGDSEIQYENENDTPDSDEAVEQASLDAW